MTDNIKLPPMPKPHTPPVFATAANTPSVKAGYELGGYEKTPPLFDEHQLEDYARDAVRLNAQAVPDGIPLNIIRKWPDGFNDRLQHVWLDVVSFIPSVKLYDLQRVLAEFGLRMEVYEDAPAAPQPLTEKDALLRQALDAIESECGFGGTNTYDPRVICDAIRKHLGVKND